MSRFWGIGVGPGDSELLTVKAVEAIRQLDILYAPQAHKGGTSVAEMIAHPYLPARLVIKRRHFPMNDDWVAKMRQWQSIAEEIIQDVQAGYQVGFLTLGDPSVYSTYSYIIQLVQDEIDVATIAGISAYSQIAASISLPLVMDEELLTIVPATAPLAQITAAVDNNDNVVIMKVSAHFKAVYQLLAARGLLERAVVVIKASMADQKIKQMTAFQADDKIPYFSTLILKKHSLKEIMTREII